VPMARGEPRRISGSHHRDLPTFHHIWDILPLSQSSRRAWATAAVAAPYLPSSIVVLADRIILRRPPAMVWVNGRPVPARQDGMGTRVDEWTDAPGLPQSVWRYRWLVAGIVLIGALGAFAWSAFQPTLYEGVVRIYVTTESGQSGNLERTVASQAQFLGSSIVSDRIIALTGNRLTLQELEQRLTVEPSANADVITVRALDETPEGAASLADTVDVAFRQVLAEQRQQAANQAIATLQEMQERLATELSRIQQQRSDADNPSLLASEQAISGQLDANANRIGQVSADSAVPTATLGDKAAVPDEPAEPKPIRTGAIGAVIGLVIGVALAWWLAGRRPAVTHDEETAQVLAHVDEDLEQADDVRQVLETLDNNHHELYRKDFAQITAERLREDFPFDRVAVLVRIHDGLEVAGQVGWGTNELRSADHHDTSLLDSLGWTGPRLIGSAERRELRNVGIVTSAALTIVAAPLEHQEVPFGVLLAGQEKPNGKVLPTGNGVMEGVGKFAEQVAPDLHTWLLLQRLRDQFNSGNDMQGQSSETGER
jgi:capsular polysaccharide biosynthesis protein